MLEFFYSNSYFVQDENNFINSLLQVGSGSVEKSTGSGSGWPKINGSDRIRILIPDFTPGPVKQFYTLSIYITEGKIHLVIEPHFQRLVSRQQMLGGTEFSPRTSPRLNSQKQANRHTSVF